MSQGSVIRDMPLRTNLIILLIFFLIGGCFILATMPSGGPGGVAAATTRGGRIFVIRPPQETQVTLPRQITIFDNNEGLSDMSRVVFYEFVNSRGEESVKSTQLPLSQWNKIAELRNKWCASTPENHLREQSPLLYDIGIRCQEPFGISARQIKLRGDEIPAELRQIIVSME